MHNPVYKIKGRENEPLIEIKQGASTVRKTDSSDVNGWDFAIVLVITAGVVAACLGLCDGLVRIITWTH